MYDDKVVQRFVDLRVQGWSFARIAQELNVSKPTLVAWSRKHQFQIQNLKAIELEALTTRSRIGRGDPLGLYRDHP